MGSMRENNRWASGQMKNSKGDSVSATDHRERVLHARMDIAEGAAAVGRDADRVVRDGTHGLSVESVFGVSNDRQYVHHGSV